MWRARIRKEKKFEAAQAGENRKGFTVVTNEVGSLAQQVSPKSSLLVLKKFQIQRKNRINRWNALRKVHGNLLTDPTI
ncbi:hypothetical protein [Oceanobacillus alkalisoli]|nr:hypothetical protein [Oceanobacillus alkalisoli]MCG5104707.1 hypothetical protein [Oceanobacillus alkalisoli]